MRYTGTRRSDELLGHHGSDTVRGGDSSDILWGDWNPKNQPEMQKDTIFGGNGTDFIYGSHGRNTVSPAPATTSSRCTTAAGSSIAARGVTSTTSRARAGRATGSATARRSTTGPKPFAAAR